MSGPVIEAIDAGHFINTQKDNCRKCGGSGFPCGVLKAAARQQRDYADRLARQQRTQPDPTQYGGLKR